MATAKLTAAITGDDTDFQRTMRRVEGTAKRTGETMSKVGATIGAGLAAVGAGLLAARMKEIGDEFDRVGKLASRFNIGAEALQGMGFAARQHGADMEIFADGAQTLAERVVEAAEGSGDMRRAFERIGMDFRQLEGLTPDRQFLKLADAVKAARGEAYTLPTVLELLGDSGGELLPLLQQGSRGIEHLSASIATLSDEKVRRIEDFNTQLRRIGESGKALAADVAASTPAINHFFRTMADGLAAAGGEGKPIGNRLWDFITKPAPQAPLDFINQQIPGTGPQPVGDSSIASLGIGNAMAAAAAIGNVQSARMKEVQRLTEETGELMRKAWFDALSDEGQLAELIRQRNESQRRFNDALAIGDDLSAARAANFSARISGDIARLEELTRKEDYQLAKAEARPTLERDGQWLAEQAMSMVRLRQVDPFPGLSALDRAQGRIESGAQGMTLIDNTANMARSLRNIEDNLERVLTFK